MKAKTKKLLLSLTLAVTLFSGSAGAVLAQTHVFENAGTCWSKTPSSGQYWYQTNNKGWVGQFGTGVYCNEGGYSSSSNYMYWTYNMNNYIDYWGEWYVWEPSRWQLYSNGYVFVPNVNATTANATYFNYYVAYPGTDNQCHGTTPYSGTTPDNVNNFKSYVRQIDYNNQFVKIWNQTGAVKCIDLVDWTGEGYATKKVGFDEVKLEW